MRRLSAVSAVDMFNRNRHTTTARWSTGSRPRDSTAALAIGSGTSVADARRSSGIARSRRSFRRHDVAQLRPTRMTHPPGFSWRATVDQCANALAIPSSVASREGRPGYGEGAVHPIGCHNVEELEWPADRRRIIVWGRCRSGHELGLHANTRARAAIRSRVVRTRVCLGDHHGKHGRSNGPTRYQDIRSRTRARLRGSHLRPSRFVPLGR